MKNKFIVLIFAQLTMDGISASDKMRIFILCTNLVYDKHFEHLLQHC